MVGRSPKLLLLANRATPIPARTKLPTILLLRRILLLLRWVLLLRRMLLLLRTVLPRLGRVLLWVRRVLLLLPKLPLCRALPLSWGRCLNARVRRRTRLWPPAWRRGR